MIDDLSNTKIAEQLLRFPCFADAKKMNRAPEDTLAIIHEAYDNENLNEGQDMAFEAVLYFNKYIDQFDLRRALSVWGADDLKVFQDMTAENHSQDDKPKDQ